MRMRGENTSSGAVLFCREKSTQQIFHFYPSHVYSEYSYTSWIQYARRGKGNACCCQRLFWERKKPVSTAFIGAFTCTRHCAQRFEYTLFVIEETTPPRFSSVFFFFVNPPDEIIPRKAIITVSFEIVC